MEKVDDEKSKEAKIDEFFALVRSFRPEAQNQPRVQVCESEGASSSAKTMKMSPPPAASQGSPAAEETASSSWVPSFKLEDFREGIEIKSSSEGVEATKEKENVLEEVERDEVESPITHPDSSDTQPRVG